MLRVEGRIVRRNEGRIGINDVKIVSKGNLFIELDDSIEV